MNKPKVIILVGTPGSGKSTYAEELYNKSEHFIQIINQDRLGNRKTCIEKMELYLKNNFDVIIDRTNINRQQRKYFIEVAKEFTNDINCVIFEIDSKECIKRIKARKNHPTIKEGTKTKKIREIVKKFEDSYEKPQFNEGFDSIITFHPIPPEPTSESKNNSLINRFRCGLVACRDFFTHSRKK